MRKGRILLTGFLLGSLLLNGCSRNSSLQVVVPKKEQESVLLNQGDESSVQEQVQAPVRYLCDKDFSNFRLLANARVIVPEVEGIQLKKIRSRNFSSEEMERMEKALMKGGAFYEIRQGVDYDTEIKETEIEGEYGYNASSQASLQKKDQIYHNTLDSRNPFFLFHYPADTVTVAVITLCNITQGLQPGSFSVISWMERKPSILIRRMILLHCRSSWERRPRRKATGESSL